MIADTHFGHEKIAALRGFSSIEEHDNTLVENWNNMVNQNDTVWILGDVAMGHEGYIDVLGKLKGYKKIVLGNHDTRPSECYLRHVERIYGAFQLKNFVLTHIPVHTSQFPRFRGNIHGHLHANNIENDDRYFCVSVEQTNLTPMLFTDIIDIFRQREEQQQQQQQ